MKNISIFLTLAVLIISLVLPYQFANAAYGNTHVVLYVNDNTNSFDVGQVVHLKGQIIEDVTSTPSGIADADFQIIYVGTRTIIHEGYTDSQGLFSFDWTPKASDEGTSVQIVAAFPGTAGYDFSQSPPIELTIVSSLTSDLTTSTNSSSQLTKPSAPPNALEVSTDKSTYTEGDKIKISGSVNPVLRNYPTVVMELKSPQGDLVTIKQLNVSTDGTFSTNILTGGSTWQDGLYTILTHYAGSQSTQISFDYGNSLKPSPERLPYSNQISQPSKSNQPSVSSHPSLPNPSIDNPSGPTSNLQPPFLSQPEINLPIDTIIIFTAISIASAMTGIIIYYLRKSKKSSNKKQVIEQSLTGTTEYEPETPDEALHELGRKIFQERQRRNEARGTMNSSNEPPKVDPRYRSEHIMTGKGPLSDHYREYEKREKSIFNTKNVYENEELHRKQEEERQRRDAEQKKQKTSNDIFDAYGILGVSRNATCEQVKARHKELIKKNTLAGILNMTSEELEKKTKIVSDLNRARDEIMKDKKCTG